MTEAEEKDAILAAAAQNKKFAASAGISNRVAIAFKRAKKRRAKLKPPATES